MWLDGIGFATPLEDPERPKRSSARSRYGITPPGPKAHHSAISADGMGLQGSKKKGATWYYAMGLQQKPVAMLKAGAGAPARQSPFNDPEGTKSAMFAKDYFDCMADSTARSAVPGLPQIIPVTSSATSSAWRSPTRSGCRSQATKPGRRPPRPSSRCWPSPEQG